MKGWIEWIASNAEGGKTAVALYGTQDGYGE